MSLARLIKPIGGAGTDKHIAGEVLRMSAQHPLARCGDAIVLDEDEPVFECPNCKRMFITAALLREHGDPQYDACHPLTPVDGAKATPKPRKPRGKGKGRRKAAKAVEPTEPEEPQAPSETETEVEE